MASVASRNLFDILADNEDVEPVVQEKESTPKENVVVQKKVDRSRASPKEARIRHEYPQRGGFKPSPSNRNEDTRSGAPRDRNVGPRLYNRREEGGEYPNRSSRGARASERGRGGRGGRRGREYDRHSGTGRYDSEKKETQGWGNALNSETIESQNNEGEADTNTNANTNASTWNDGATDDNAGGGWGEPTEGQDLGAAQDSGSGWENPVETTTTEEWEHKEEGTATNGESAPVVEQEESFKTLDEYRAEKPPKAQVATLPEARKANEGVDDSQWKDAVPLEKDDDDDSLFAGKEHSFRLKSKKAKAKNFIEIEQTFVEKPGAGFPRGRGRGRGGGPRGRGGDRRDNRDGRDNYEGDNRRRNSGGGRGRSRGRGDYVNLDDQRAFPSLGAQ